MVRIVIIGEALLELSHPHGRGDRLSYGGDTLNTAIYLARLGQTPHFITAMGIDPYSDDVIRQCRAEGVRINHVLRHPGRLPGLYAIQLDAAGERRFHYWRGESAARAFFDLDRADEALAFAREADWLYLSGITLSIFQGPEQACLGEVARAVRARGGEVVFDPNYRSNGWATRQDALDAIEVFARHVTLALPTLEDENALYGDASAGDHAARWADWGVRQTALKCGAMGAILFGEEGGVEGQRVAVTETVPPVDTTGAGDSFNAAFISARISGLGPVSAAMAANRLAGVVIRHPGAIVPRAAMADATASS